MAAVKKTPVRRTKVTYTGAGGNPTFLKPKKEKPVKSEFLEWFVLQFGKRPSPKALHELREDVERYRYDLVKSEGLLEAVQLWDHRKTASIYAWNAKETILNEKRQSDCTCGKPTDQNT